MAAPQAKFCTAVHSHWILMAILMCDETLSVWFKHGICVNYRGSNINHYRQMIGAASPGRWLHRNLYRILPYKVIPLPCPAAGCGVMTSCCPNSIPTNLHLSLAGGGSCACMSGTFPLTWSSSGGTFGGPAGLGSQNLCTSTAFIFECTGPGPYIWDLTIKTGPFEIIHNQADAGSTCSPFVQTFSGLNAFLFNDACSGCVSATVTS
jgi:hypothetical protein